SRRSGELVTIPATSRPSTASTSGAWKTSPAMPYPAIPHRTSLIAGRPARTAKRSRNELSPSDSSPPRRLVHGPVAHGQHPVRARPRRGEDDRLRRLLGAHHPRDRVVRPARAHREVGGHPARGDRRATHAVLAHLVVERAREA